MAGLYIHIPFCQSKCSYCAFYSEDIRLYNPDSLVSALITEIKTYPRSELTSEIQTVYIGGGSPTCIPPEQLFRLIEYITEVCPKTIEFTVETNPAQLNFHFLKGLIERNVNRISIGAQSFTNSELKLLGRVHSADDITKAFTSARQAGFTNISLDLIFAIPAASMKNFRHSLDKAISLNPEHISAYSLSIEPGTKFAQAVAQNKLVQTDQETDLQMYESAITKIESASLIQYEISNFAKPGFECKHNLSCWHNEPYIGIGPSAWSYYKGTRYANIANINRYIEKINNSQSPVIESHTPDIKEIACETAVLNLRTRRGIDIEEFKKKTGFDPLDIFAEPIRSNLKAGMLEITETPPQTIRLTRKALPIADKILCEFATF